MTSSTWQYHYYIIFIINIVMQVSQRTTITFYEDLHAILVVFLVFSRPHIATINSAFWMYVYWFSYIFF